MDGYPCAVTSPIDWPDLPAAQQPPWPDRAEVDRAVAELRALPPLVFAGECDLLMRRLADVAEGRAFVLMGGDCAETFESNTADSIRARLKTLLQMSVVLTYAASMPVVKVGRLAGQYFKPRSKPIESRDGVELTSYFGDAVNALEFDPDRRRPDAQRLVRTYNASSAALNLVRAFTQGGYADLRQVHDEVVATMRDGLGPYSALVQQLQKAVGRNFNWVRDVTVSNSTWGNRELRFFEPNAGVHATGGGIGMGMPMAIGAAVGAAVSGSGRKTLGLAGDGGFILNLGELATLVQEECDTLIVLMNDQRYGVIQNIQDASYGGRRCYVELHTPDYAQLCASIQLPHARVSNLEELPAVLPGAWAKKGPFLLEIDMRAIGSFKTTFSGPPVNKLDQVPATKTQ